MVMVKAKVVKVKRPNTGPTVPPSVRARVSLRKGVPRKINLDRIRVTEDELEASICRDDFYHFVRAFTEVVIAEEMVWNWHIPYLCKQLQAMAERVFKGEAKLYDLVINIPPGTTKSTICSVMFPAWIWTRMKEARFIGASYAHHLAMDLARKCRDVVTSEKYRRLFPEIELRTDQNTKGYFANTSGGYRYSVGTNGSVLGMHAHFIVVDDPIDPESVESELDLAAANRWMKTTLSTRKVNKQVSVTVLVMQRLHQDDPTANFLKLRPVRWIKLPAEVSDGPVPEALKTRYRDGLLDPVRLSWKVIEEEKAKGPQYYSSQFRQNPVPPGGAMFNTAMIKVGVPPAKWARLVRFWDKAASSGKGDYTVGLLLGLCPDNRLWVLDVVRGRWDTHARDQKILRTAEEDGTRVLVGVEQEPGSGGKESAEATVRRLVGYRVKVVKVDSTTGGKERRADPVSYQVNGGNLYLKANEPWIDAFKSELEFFPYSKHDDQVDALSGAFNLLGKVRRPAGALGAGQNLVELQKPKNLQELVTGLLKDRKPTTVTRRILLGGSKGRKEGQGA